VAAVLAVDAAPGPVAFREVLMPTRVNEAFPNAIDEPVETTLLELVQSLAREGGSEHEIVAAVLELVDNEEVVLIGSFRGQRLL
jgi:hypothetical protein